MQQVNVYIEQQFTGNFGSGMGKFSVVLETETDRGLATKEHYKGYKGTTRNRLPLLACIEALKCMKKPCEINIHIDSPYVCNMAGKIEWGHAFEIKKNRALWYEYIKLAKEHLVMIFQEERNTYSPAMEIQLKKREIELVEDNREGE